MRIEPLIEKYYITQNPVLLESIFKNCRNYIVKVALNKANGFGLYLTPEDIEDYMNEAFVSIMESMQRYRFVCENCDAFLSKKNELDIHALRMHHARYFDAQARPPYLVCSGCGILWMRNKSDVQERTSEHFISCHENLIIPRFSISEYVKHKLAEHFYIISRRCKRNNSRYVSVDLVSKGEILPQSIFNEYDVWMFVDSSIDVKRVFGDIASLYSEVFLEGAYNKGKLLQYRRSKGESDYDVISDYRRYCKFLQNYYNISQES